MTVLLLAMVMIAVVGINLLRGGIWLWLSLPCYGVLAVAAIISAFRSSAIPRPAIRSTIAASGAFFAYIAVRILSSPVEHIARNELFSLAAAFILYLLVAVHLVSANLRGTVVAVLLMAAAANCVIGAIQFTQANDFMPFPELSRVSYGTRASGFLGSPNHLAGFLEMVLLLGLAMTFWSRWRIWAKVLLGYGSIVCIAGIVLTGSRGGYISTMAGLLVFAVLSFLVLARQRFDRLGYVLGTVLVVLLIAGLSAAFLLEASDALRLRVQTATTLDSARMSIWPSAIQQFHLSPIFGTGAGTFLYYGRQFRDPILQTDPQFAHNDYLQLLAEFGIVGLLALFVFLIIHIRSGWKAMDDFLAQRNQFEPVGNTAMALTIGALSALAAIAVHSIVDFNMHIPANALLVAFVIGILGNPGNAPLPNATEPASGGRLFRLVLPALGVGILFAGWPKWIGDYHAHRARLALADWTTLETGEYAVRAETAARRGLKYDPKNIDLLNYLGESLAARAALAADPAEQERLYLESVAAYREALRLAPMDRNILLGLGWSLDPLKRFDESEPVFRRAVELDPNSGHVRWAYAAHLHLRGRLEEAEAEYQKAASLGSMHAQNALRRLEEERKARASGSPPSAAQ